MIHVNHYNDNITLYYTNSNYFFISIYKVAIYATFYYALTGMQHYKVDTMRSKGQCLPQTNLITILHYKYDAMGSENDYPMANKKDMQH